MIRSAWMLALVALGCTLGSSSLAQAQLRSPTETLESSIEVLNDMSRIKNQSIPASLMKEAQAVAIIPHVVKIGFVVTGRAGHGVVFTRDKSGFWGEPTFVTFRGGGVGFQAGVQATDVVLIFKSKNSLERVLDGKRKLTLGADAAVAAGPVGRDAEAGTDARLKSEILSYSRSRGLFAGVSLEGSSLANDESANSRYSRNPTKSMTDSVNEIKAKMTEMGTEK